MPQMPIMTNNIALNPNVNNTGGINWVAGLNGANAWRQYANSNDILMDSINENIYYIKSCDGIGHSTIRAFKYQEISLDEVPIKDPNAMPQTNAVTKEEFDAFKTEVLEYLKSNNRNYHNNKKGQSNNERS